MVTYVAYESTLRTMLLLLQRMNAFGYVAAYSSNIFDFSLLSLVVFIVIVIFHGSLATFLDQLTGHNITCCLQYIEIYWYFSCKEDNSQ